MAEDFGPRRTSVFRIAHQTQICIPEDKDLRGHSQLLFVQNRFVQRPQGHILFHVTVLL